MVLHNFCMVSLIVNYSSIGNNSNVFFAFDTFSLRVCYIIMFFKLI